MTTDLIDLGPAARQLAGIVRGVTDEQLGAPTPCPDYTVGDLLDHIGGLAKAFTWAATKESLAMPDHAPSGDASRLGDDWRRRIPADRRGARRGLAGPGGVDRHDQGRAGRDARRDRRASSPSTRSSSTAGTSPRRPASRSRSTSRRSRPCHGFAAMFSGPGTEEQRAGGFGPELSVPADAPLLDRVLAMLGRDAGWRR